MGKLPFKMKAWLFSRYVWAAFFCITIVTVWVVFSELPDYKNAIGECRSACGTVVLDSENRLLYIFPDSAGRLTLWKTIQEFPELLQRAVIAAEDKRFLSHYGFDPIAIVRALLTNIRRGRTVSGASTITQQAVRLITPRPRTYASKIYELFAGIKMELQLSKPEIMELYLNLSPMGGNIRGAGLAALVYFDKDVQHINRTEAAVLAAVPRSPYRMHPRLRDGRERLAQEKDRILKRLGNLQWISQHDLNRLVGAPINFRITSLEKRAPHFVDFVTATAPKTGVILKTTLNLDLQRTVERIARSHQNRLADMGIEQAGVMVNSASGEILAMVGSLHYGRRNQGYNNAVLSQRGAGSTLKPFLYALALEKGYSASSEIPDTFQSYRTPHGDYLPHNADKRNYGPVTARSALGNSLNIPAVKVAGDTGIADFFALLQQLDLVSRGSSSPEQYGLGLAIGNMEVSLYRLVGAYGAFVRAGEYRPTIAIKGAERSNRQVFSPQTAYVINHILADHTARLLTFGNPSWLNFGFPVSVKTGTSSNYRDCWAVAYTSQHVIGTWAGNFSGRPTNGVAGSTACGPMVKDIVQALYRGRPPAPFKKPDGLKEVTICSLSGKHALPTCPYRAKDFCMNGESSLSTIETVQGAEKSSQDRDEICSLDDVCDMRHDRDQYRLLSAPYAQWLDRRETEQGPGRFRLIRPEPSPTNTTDPTPLVFRELTTGNKTQRIEIVSPHDEDRFVLSPHRLNQVLFRAIPHPVVDAVTWLINGVEISKTPPPYEFSWELIRGTHIVHAVTPSKTAARIVIHVE